VGGVGSKSGSESFGVRSISGDFSRNVPHNGPAGHAGHGAAANVDTADGAATNVDAADAPRSGSGPDPTLGLETPQPAPATPEEYFEAQTVGADLCALHALNNILGQMLFTLVLVDMYITDRRADPVAARRVDGGATGVVRTECL